MNKHLTRMTKLAQWAACLSSGEAAACWRDYRSGLDYSSEAVAHYGGTSAVVKRVVELRTNYAIREMLRDA